MTAVTTIAAVAAMTAMTAVALVVSMADGCAVVTVRRMRGMPTVARVLIVGRNCISRMGLMDGFFVHTAVPVVRLGSRGSDVIGHLVSSLQRCRIPLRGI